MSLRLQLMTAHQQSFYVRAIWDPEASVWYSQTDIPGLNIEAEDLTEFQDLLDHLAPEMLADNLGIHGRTVLIDFQVAERRELAVA